MNDKFIIKKLYISNKQITLLTICTVLMLLSYLLDLSNSTKNAGIYYIILLASSLIMPLVRVHGAIKCIKYIFFSLLLTSPYYFIVKADNANNLLSIFIGLIIGCVLSLFNIKQFKSAILKKTLKSKVSLNFKQKIITIFEMLLTPILEEVIFRIILISWLFVDFGYISIVISSILFVLFHYFQEKSKYFYNLKIYLFQFLLSMILGYLYISTNSILGCIVAHFIFNSWKLIEVINRPVKSNNANLFNDY